MAEDESNEMVSCPLCGMPIHKNGLGSHKGSKRCTVNQNKQEIKERDLVPIPNSSKVREFLEEQGYPVERIGYKYNDDTYFNHKDTVQKRYYTTREGANESRQYIFPNASENGYKVEIVERIEGQWVCRVTDEGISPVGDELVVIDVDTSEDVSRRRVAYLRTDDQLAFTTDGDRIGEYKRSERAMAEWSIDPATIMSKVV